MKVAITGVAGKLGLVLADLLDKDPEVEAILGLDIAVPKFHSPKFSFEKADMRDADFGEILRGCDAICHLAFIVEPVKNMSMETIDHINIEGSRRVFEGAAAAGVSKIVYASSIASYGAHGDNPRQLLETAPLRPNPDWYYSRAKGAVEFILNDFEEKYPGIKVIRFRPSIIMGATIQNPIGDMFKPPFILNALSDDYYFDFCWNEDIAVAFQLALSHDESDIFNLSAGSPINVPEACALTGKRMIRVKHSLLLPVVKLLVKLGVMSQGDLEWFNVGFRGGICPAPEKAWEKLGWRCRYDSSGSLLAYVKAKGYVR